MKKMIVPLSTFLCTGGILLFTVFKAPFPLLMAQRLWGINAAYVEIFTLATYGALVTYFLGKSALRLVVRRYIWLLFSILFFGQLILGISGLDVFLQTGQLHYPVPALMISGPIYRGGGLFMLMLFLSTIVLSGPAWCSHLCYVGAIDNWLAKGERRREFSPSKFLKSIRFVTLISTLLFPLIFTLTHGPSYVVHTAIVVYIVLSLVFFYVSWKTKISAHCSLFCPISLVVNILRKVNPFRLRINSGCDLCMRCRKTCKYLAITNRGQDIQINGRCNLCMDCTSICHKNSIMLSFFNKINVNNNLFYIITVSLHTVFIALARI